MAGIGIRLNNLFQKNTLTTDLLGFFYSTVVTVAPMFVIIINLVLMEYFLDFFVAWLCRARAIFLYSIVHVYLFTVDIIAV